MVKTLQLRGLENRRRHEVQTAVTELGTNRTFTNSVTYRKNRMFVEET